MGAAVASLLRSSIWRWHRQMQKTRIAACRILPNLLLIIGLCAAVILMLMIVSTRTIAQRQKELYGGAKRVVSDFASNTRAFLKNQTACLNLSTYLSLRRS
jgi:hypothetical protein